MMKKGIIIILIAVMLGGGFAYYLFNNIVVKEKDTDKTMVNAFQVGAFTSYDNAVRVAERDNGIVVKDEDIFRVYVAILYDKEAVNKLEDYYNCDVDVEWACEKDTLYLIQCRPITT